MVKKRKSKLSDEALQAKADADAAKAAIAKVLGKDKRKNKRNRKKKGQQQEAKPPSRKDSGKSQKSQKSKGRRSRKPSQAEEKEEILPPLSEVTRDPNEPVLFVGSIPHEANRNQIIRTFTKYCKDEKIRACKMPTSFMKHLNMRHHRGFAFVVLQNQQDLACILDMHQTDGIYIEGFDTPLQCKIANQTEDMPAVREKRKQEARNISNQDQLFVGGIPWTATEQDLREFFQEHGKIEQLFMPRWPTNPKTGLQKHKGYAFVRFSPETFEKAKLLAEKGEKFLGKYPNIPIKINIAKGTEPAFPRSLGAQRERMQYMYNPYHHPAEHVYPSALPIGVYKRVYGNRPPPQPTYSYETDALRAIST